MQKILLIMTLATLIMSILASFFSSKTRLVDRQISDLQSENIKNQELLQNFKAEWNYLNDAEYLDKMRKKHLPHLQKKGINTENIINVRDKED